MPFGGDREQIVGVLGERWTQGLAPDRSEALRRRLCAEAPL